MSYYRRPRRKRFTVTCSHPSLESQQQVILAHSAERARAWFERRGLTVFKVEQGDFRAHVERSTDRAWDFNLPAIREAFEAMAGEPLPANIRFISDRRGIRMRGWFQAHPREGTPTVKVRANLTPVQANRTLWHELGHVKQFVIDHGGDQASWAREWAQIRARRYGYENRPWEREAREWECLAETDFLLTTTKGAIQ